MDLFKTALSTAAQFYRDLNPSTLSGAIDIIVVRQPPVLVPIEPEGGPGPGSASPLGRKAASKMRVVRELRASPVHVRFGKLKLLRPVDNRVLISVNGRTTELTMRVGQGGDAYFVRRAPPEIGAPLDPPGAVSPEAPSAAPGPEGPSITLEEAESAVAAAAAAEASAPGAPAATPPAPGSPSGQLDSAADPDSMDLSQRAVDSLPVVEESISELSEALCSEGGFPATGASSGQMHQRPSVQAALEAGATLLDASDPTSIELSLCADVLFPGMALQVGGMPGAPAPGAAGGGHGPADVATAAPAAGSPIIDGQLGTAAARVFAEHLLASDKLGLGSLVASWPVLSQELFAQQPGAGTDAPAASVNRLAVRIGGRVIVPWRIGALAVLARACLGPHLNHPVVAVAGPDCQHSLSLATTPHLGPDGSGVAGGVDEPGLADGVDKPGSPPAGAGNDDGPGPGPGPGDLDAGKAAAPGPGTASPGPVSPSITESGPMPRIHPSLSSSLLFPLGAAGSSGLLTPMSPQRPSMHFRPGSGGASLPGTLQPSPTVGFPLGGAGRRGPGPLLDLADTDPDTQDDDIEEVDMPSGEAPAAGAADAPGPDEAPPAADASGLVAEQPSLDGRLFQTLDASMASLLNTALSHALEAAVAGGPAGMPEAGDLSAADTSAADLAADAADDFDLDPLSEGSSLLNIESGFADAQPGPPSAVATPVPAPAGGISGLLRYWIPFSRLGGGRRVAEPAARPAPEPEAAPAPGSADPAGAVADAAGAVAAIEADAEAAPATADAAAALAGAAPPAANDQNSFVRSIYFTSEELSALDLKDGPNHIEFTIESPGQGASCAATIYLWDYTDKIVISDIDGTITKSDALGHIFTAVGRDWTHSGVATLFSNIASNGYRLMYVTSRAIGQANSTRGFLRSVKQSPPPNALPSPSSSGLFQSHLSAALAPASSGLAGVSPAGSAPASGAASPLVANGGGPASPVGGGTPSDSPRLAPAGGGPLQPPSPPGSGGPIAGEAAGGGAHAAGAGAGAGAAAAPGPGGALSRSGSSGSLRPAASAPRAIGTPGQATSAAADATGAGAGASASPSTHLDSATLMLVSSPRDADGSLQPRMHRLPPGPLICAPDRLLAAFTREVIERKPHVFKMAALGEILKLFPADTQPFYAGFGNRPTDALSYQSVMVPIERIFTINPSGNIRLELVETYRSTYSDINDIVDQMFPPIVIRRKRRLTLQRPAHKPGDSLPDDGISVESSPDELLDLPEEPPKPAFNDFHYWRQPLPDISALLPSKPSTGGKGPAAGSAPAKPSAASTPDPRSPPSSPAPARATLPGADASRPASPAAPMAVAASSARSVSVGGAPASAPAAPSPATRIVSSSGSSTPGSRDGDGSSSDDGDDDHSHGDDDHDHDDDDDDDDDDDSDPMAGDGHADHDGETVVQFRGYGFPFY
ncbi:hypothetical protein H696_01390 [Fonticula alba]|uniref:LNS2/PITP domain-containing protein n=1 Tax=Fonticula alba TaxID=691883 RepID=A0A058ZEV1_FONAL|nr:hypothetical protein H696_01390 [Fonticula alba]KCV71982.1 hypothetical protein H696_01390 [Fonticula alba]|eukprot:XP_009493560.1 hypothetical protein H696_01390 [Fonticula alba]